jgi:hypothetical protein
MIPPTSGLSASSSAKTHFSSKDGTFFPDSNTVEWRADNGVRMVSYKEGRDKKSEYPKYDKGNYLTVMIELANRARAEGQAGIFSQTLVRGIWPLQRIFHWHLVFDPHLIPLVTSFSRHPEDCDTTDLSTPYDCKITRNTAEQLGLHLSSLNLSAEPNAVLQKSLSDYFSEGHHKYSEWAKFANECYFKLWSQSGEFIKGHDSFALLAWATVSKFVLGAPEADFTDYSHIWTTLLQGTKGIPQQLYTKMWHYPGLETYLLDKIRQAIVNYRTDPIAFNPGTIIHFWLKHNMAHALCEKLSTFELEKASNAAEAKGMTLEELIYMNNFIIVMIGMQENMAFVLTQIAYHFARDPFLKEKCAGNREACTNMVWETLRFMPPAGISRQLRWDTDIVDPIYHNTYRFNKGDQLITLPAVTQHLEPFSTQHDHFDIHRPHTNPNAFSAGPHRCPGQIAALSWLCELTLVLAQYQFTKEGENDPDYYCSFILRDGDMKLKMSL